MAFSASFEMVNETAKIYLEGELDASVAGQFKETIEQAAAKNPTALVLYMESLEFMASAGLRVLVFAKQKMGTEVKIYLIGCTDPVLSSLKMSGFHHSVYLMDTYEEN